MNLKVAIDLTLEQTVGILRVMTPEAKKYTCGDVDENEMAGWRAFSSACDFPTMTLADAVKFWRNN